MRERALPLIFVVVACGSSSTGTNGAAPVDGGKTGGDVDGGGGGGGDGGGGTTVPGDSAGTSTGSIDVTVRIQWSNIPTPRGNAQAIVQDTMGNPLEGAVVTITPADGSPMTATSSNLPGIYNAPLTTWATAYDVSVTHAQGARSGIHLISPPVHTVTLSQALAATTALPITWTPNADPNIQVDVEVQSSAPAVDFDAQTDDSSFDKSDKGAYTIPATAFPSSGSYAISVERGVEIAVPGAFVGLINVTTVDDASF